MGYRILASRRGWIGSALLLGTLLTTGVALAFWKISALKASEAAAATQPEPMEAATAAVASSRAYRPTTTSVGTVLATRSITLENEVAGTVRRVALTPGRIVEPGQLLVALDVSVEEAELEAQKAQAALAQTTLSRLQNLSSQNAVAQEEVDQATAARDVAQAQMARTRAVIARKTIRAPFRARVGIADVHPGQYLNEGTQLTTLQGVDDRVNVDFTVSQRIATGLAVGDEVAILAGGDDATPVSARITAIDSRVDPTTRNAMVRAEIKGGRNLPSPGASVRVKVPAGPQGKAVAVPVSALRKDPSGDHVFVIQSDKDGKERARLRQVRSGEALGDTVLIEDGLEPGELVATSGSFKLREGVLVALATDSTATAEGAR
jgi:membrane fusion protein (multidrug efflux system)